MLWAAPWHRGAQTNKKYIEANTLRIFSIEVPKLEYR